MPNRSEEFPSNCDNGFLAASAFLQVKILVLEFRAFVGLATAQRDLNKERFQLRSRATYTSGFLLSRALLILRSKPCP